MHYINLHSTSPSVKLYPRLAMHSGPHPSKRRVRTSRIQKRLNTVEDERTAARRQVRARLLQMILENERVRRHEQRPNLS
jgi:hypothetical protein